MKQFGLGCASTVAMLAWSAPGLAQSGAQSGAQANPQDSIVVTGDRYLDEVPSSATKTRTPAIETPQSIVTVTRRQMDDQNAQTVGAALRYSAGVLSDIDATSRYDTVFLRGFGGFSTSANFVSFLDGLKLPRGQAFAQLSVDPFLLDRIEIVKGPSAVLYGQVSPGGLVNQTSRVPTRDAGGEIRAEAGSHGRVQLGLASRGALNDSGTLRYSIAGIARSSGTRFDRVDERRVAIAPALTWAPDADTSLTVSGFYTHDPKGGYFNSTLARGVAPAAYRSALNSTLNFGDPGTDRFDREQVGIGYRFSRRFGAIGVESALRYARADADFQATQLVGLIDAATGLLPRATVRSNETAQGIATDNHLAADVKLGGITNRLLLGVDYQHNRADWRYAFAAATSLNVLRPVYDQPLGTFMTLINNRQTQSQTGLYAQDQIEAGRLRVTLGIRHDWTDLRTHDKTSGSDSRQSADKTSYRAGILYLFDFGLAPYASYATSFEPTIGVGADGKAFRPTTGRQYEAGLKYQRPGAPWLLTASAFDIRQDNTLTASATPGFNVQQGAIGSRGLELEVRGSVTRTLELIAAATVLDTKVLKSNTAGVAGKRPQAVPEQFASLWASYRIPAGLLAGLHLGAGVRYVGASFGDDLNTVRTPAYGLADLGLRYELGGLQAALAGAQLTLNVSNLFDKEYYTSCSYNIYCQFGNRRQVLGGLRYAW